MFVRLALFFIVLEMVDVAVVSCFSYSLVEDLGYLKGADALLEWPTALLACEFEVSS